MKIQHRRFWSSSINSPFICVLNRIEMTLTGIPTLCDHIIGSSAWNNIQLNSSILFFHFFSSSLAIYLNFFLPSLLWKCKHCIELHRIASHVSPVLNSWVIWVWVYFKLPVNEHCVRCFFAWVCVCVFIYDKWLGKQTKYIHNSHPVDVYSNISIFIQTFRCAMFHLLQFHFFVVVFLLFFLNDPKFYQAKNSVAFF